MLDDSEIGRMAQDILRWLDPETQRLLEIATPDEHKTYQHFFAAYAAGQSGEPYGHLYLAFGMIIAEIAEKPKGLVN